MEERNKASYAIRTFVSRLQGREIVELVFALGVLEGMLTTEGRSEVVVAEDVLEKIKVAELEAPGYRRYYASLRQAIGKLLP